MVKLLQEFICYIVLVAAIIIFFPSIIFQNHIFTSSGMVLSDLYLFNYPVKDILHQSLHEGFKLPYWTDLIGNGFPILAESQIGALYPLHILLFSLPIKTFVAFNYTILVHFVLAAFGTYAYLRKSLRLSLIAALSGSLIFTFSGFMIYHLVYNNVIEVVAYLPLILLTIDKLLERSEESFPTTKKLYSHFGIYAAVLAVLFTLLSLAGHLEFAYYTIGFSLIYSFTRILVSKELRELLVYKAGILICSLILCAMVIAPQIAATAELLPLSIRNTGVATEASSKVKWPFETLSLFINPYAYPLYTHQLQYKVTATESTVIGEVYLYIGLLPLVFVFYTLIKLVSSDNKQLKSWTIIFLVLGIGTYVVAIGDYTPVYGVLRSVIPGLSMLRNPTKLVFLIEFFLTVIAAIGIEYALSTRLLQKTKFAVLIIPAIIYANQWLVNKPIQPTVSADWLNTPPIAKFLQSQATDCHCDPSVKNFRNWRIYSKGTDIADDNRILETKLHKELQNLLREDFNAINQIPSSYDYSTLPLARQNNLNYFKMSFDPATSTILAPPDFKDSANLQSVKYILSDIQLNDQEYTLVQTYNYKTSYNHLFQFVGNQKGTSVPSDAVYVYENRNYEPRIKIVSLDRIVSVASDQDPQGNSILKALINRPPDSKGKLIVEDFKHQDHKPSENLTSSYLVRDYQPDTITLQTTTSQPAFLSITDTYYPGWKAYLDKKEIPIYRTNYSFRGVAVPQGNHLVIFKYQPSYLWWSTIIAIIGGALTTSCIVAGILVNKLR